MDGPELSKHERSILDGIERELCADELLDRRLRTLSRGIRPWTPRRTALERRIALLTWLLAAACVAVFARAVATQAPTLLWTFAALWVLTAVSLLRIACDWGSRKVTARAHRSKE